jgi:DNA-binding GntR family transcriptional regulator
MTVHRAPRELNSEGPLTRVQGAGTFVTTPKPRSALLECDWDDRLRFSKSSAVMMRRTVAC